MRTFNVSETFSFRVHPHFAIEGGYMERSDMGNVWSTEHLVYVHHMVCTHIEFI